MDLMRKPFTGLFFLILINILTHRREVFVGKVLGDTVRITDSSVRDGKLVGGSRIVWLPSRKFYLCDNYHFSVSTPNSYIYPKLEIYILDSTLTQGFTVFLRCGKLATPYNYDIRINIPSGITKGTKIESKLPLCNFPLLYNNAYNIDIYIGNVDIEFTRRHYCPCSPEYVVLSIGCLVEYNSNDIVTLSPSKEYSINGFLTSTMSVDLHKKASEKRGLDNDGDLREQVMISGMQIAKIPERTNKHKLPLNNLKIISTPTCVLENNEYVTFCNVNLFFSIYLSNEGDTRTNHLIEEEKNLNNICVYISPYVLKEGIVNAMNDDEKGGERYLSDINAVFSDGDTENSLSSIPVLRNHLISPFSPNICIGLAGVLQSLRNHISNHTIRNERLPSQLRSYLDSVTIQLFEEEDKQSGLKKEKSVTTESDDIKNLDKSSSRNAVLDQKIKVSLVLNNVRPSKYFVYPFVLQYTSESVGSLGEVESKGGGGFNDYYVKLHYSLNYLQYSSNNHVVRWFPVRTNNNYGIRELPKAIGSKLVINVDLNTSFYVVIPKIVTNILSFDSNKLEVYIEKELSFLLSRLNSTLNIEYTGLLGRYPLQENYSVFRGESEVRGAKIINFVDENKLYTTEKSSSDIHLNLKRQVLEIEMPTSVISLGMPFAMRFTINSVYPTELPIRSLNLEIGHKLIPVSCNKNTCSGHGDCFLNEYIGNINIYCSCYPGWGGLYCSEPYLSYQSILAYPISLVGTNFVAIPTIYVCVCKRKWLVAFLAFIAGSVSSVFHAAEVGLLIDHGNVLLKGDLISAQLIISFVFILLCRFKQKVEITLLVVQIVILVLLTLFTSRLTTTVIPLIFCFSIIFGRVFYWYYNTKMYSEKIPSNGTGSVNLEISCTIPIELTDTPNTPKNITSKEHHNEFNSYVKQKKDVNCDGVGEDELEELDEIDTSRQTNNQRSGSDKAGQSDVSVPFDISKLTEMVSLCAIMGSSSSGPVSHLEANNLTPNGFNENSIAGKFRYYFTNMTRKLLFIFQREYFSPKYILIGILCGTFGCITWFLETVDTYWIFHSLWHIMAFLASTFIIYGCIPNNNWYNYNANGKMTCYSATGDKNCRVSSFSDYHKDFNKNEKSRIQSNNDSKTVSPSDDYRSCGDERTNII